MPATYTDHYNFKKPGYDSTADIGDINDNMDIADGALDALTNSIGIVVDGDEAAIGVTAGQYVIVRGSTISNVDDGLYKAVNNVSAGTAFTFADLVAVSGGLGSGMTTMDNHIANNAFVYRGRIDQLPNTTTSNFKNKPCGIYYTGANSWMSCPAWSYIYKVQNTSLGGSIAISSSGNGKLYYYDPDSNKYILIKN